MKRKRIVIFTAILIIAAIIGYRLYINYQYSNYKGYQSSLIADFTKNGKNELLTVKCTYGDDPQHILELEDMETHKIVWKKRFPKINYTAKIYELCLSDTFFIFTESYTTTDSINKEENLHVDLHCLSGRTGEFIWKKPFFTQKIPHSSYCEIQENKGDVFLFSDTEAKKSQYAVSKIDPQNGKQLWEVILPEKLYLNPRYWGKKKILFYDSGKIFCMDVETGDTNTIRADRYIRDLFIPNDETIYFVTANDIYKYDTTMHYCKTYNKRRRGFKDTTIEFDDFAFYNNRLICLNTFYRYPSDSTYDIHSIPIQENIEGYEYEIEPDFYVSTIFCNRHSHLFKGKGERNIFSTRYIPLQLWKYDQTSKQAADSIGKLDPSKMVIFDFQEGKAIWESKTVNHLYLSNYASDSNYHYFYYRVPYKDTTERVRLTFNGKTGKFHKAIHFKDIPEQYIDKYGEERFGEKQIYRLNKNITWCLSFPELELKYSTEDIDVQDAKAILEETLGKMPWQKNN